MRTELWSENLKGRDHSEKLGVDGMIILEWKYGGNAQDRNQWWALVNPVVKLRVP
jgi:hypothetical protein